MKISFDVISDLNLTPDESFNWEGKATSLYCIIAGNISNDLRTIYQTLTHLSKFYQGVFYTAGSLEYENIEDFRLRSEEIYKLCAAVKNVAFLHNHVVIVDGVAILGANGWYGNTPFGGMFSELRKEEHRYEDISYLGNTIEKLQLHMDVRKIVAVTNSVPNIELFFGEVPEGILDQLPPNIALINDTEHKTSHWIFGSFDKTVDTVISGVNYVNNSYFKRRPYWAKVIEITI